MENALGILEKLNDRLPKSPPILNDLAIVYSGTGNHLKALETYQLLISTNGANPHTILSCMKAMLALGRAEEALELLTSNQANLKESLELTLAKADCLRHNKQYSAAALLLENESIRQPTNEDILRQLVALYRESDDKLNFERSLRKWLAVNPDNPIAQHLLLSLENVTEEHLESRASDQYVREVFDRFASHFEHQPLSKKSYSTSLTKSRYLSIVCSTVAVEPVFAVPFFAPSVVSCTVSISRLGCSVSLELNRCTTI
jgi:tetratricopeptide (TPR) repeat protein